MTLKYIVKILFGLVFIGLILNVFIQECKNNKQKSKLDRRSKEEIKRKLKSIKDK